MDVGLAGGGAGTGILPGSLFGTLLLLGTHRGHGILQGTVLPGAFGTFYLRRDVLAGWALKSIVTGTATEGTDFGRELVKNGIHPTPGAVGECSDQGLVVAESLVEVDVGQGTHSYEVAQVLLDTGGEEVLGVIFERCASIDVEERLDH